MTMWRRTRTESGGAWRSVRYDLSGGEAGRGGDGPDVTSTGMNTFGGPTPPPRPWQRRMAAISAFGALAAVGSVGSYLAVLNGFGAPAAPGTRPGAEPYPLTSAGAPADAGMGAGSVEEPLGRRPARTVSPTVKAEVRTSPPRPKPRPTVTACCPRPPVPTPTMPTSVATPDDPSATPEPGDSWQIITPGSGPWDIDEDQGWHRRWRHHWN